MLLYIRRYVLYLLAAVLLFSPVLGVLIPTGTAYAGTGAVDNPQVQLERWLFYRGMRACMHDPDFKNGPGDNKTISASDINKGQLNIQTGRGFGYMAPSFEDGKDTGVATKGAGTDGTIGCSDGSIWVRGATVFGFDNVLALICEMNRNLPDGEGGRIEPDKDGGPGKEDCESATEVYFDGGDSAFEGALTKALENGGDKNRPLYALSDNDNSEAGYTDKALRYLIGWRSLVNFCGAVDSSIDNLLYETDDFSGDKVVSARYVKPDGTTDERHGFTIGGRNDKNNFWDSDRNESSTVNDVWYDTGGDYGYNARDMKCSTMATWTRDNAQGYADWVKLNPEEAEKNDSQTQQQSNNPSGGSGSGEATQCNIPKTGWILCPVLDTMANIGDQAFSFLADNFLSVDTELFSTKDSSGNDSGTYAAWKVFRDLANVAFVIAVMVVVYSQLTGAGLSNYGIKKLLPKIVAAAILVNLSYFICQLAVDISNILGATLREFFASVAIQLPGGDVSSATTSTSNDSPLGWVGIVGIIVVAGTVAWLAIGALIPVLVAAIIAMFMILFILLARKALIVLLIALAPLAFVAYLLPNTEQWFKRWQKTFVQLLMVYPIIAIVFGASTLASSIVSGSAASGNASDNNIMLKIIAAGIAVIPLFVVPGLLKKSIDATGNIGTKLNGIGNKVGGFAGKKAGDRFDQSAIMKGRKFRREERGRTRDRRFAERAANGSLAARGFGGITRGGRAANNKLALRATADADKYAEQDIAEANTFLTGQGITNDQWQQIALGGNYTGADGKEVKVSEAAQRAAVRKQAASGNHEHVQQLVDNARSLGTDGLDGSVRRDIASSLASSSNKPTWASQTALNDIAGTSGNAVKSTDEYIDKAVESGAYSAEKIATGDKDELIAVSKRVASTPTTATNQAAKQQLIDNAHTALTDPRLAGSVAKNRTAVEHIQNHTPHP